MQMKNGKEKGRNNEEAARDRGLRKLLQAIEKLRLIGENLNGYEVILYK